MCPGVCDVVVIGPNTALPEGIDAQQLTVSSSFIIEVIKERLSGKIPSAESFPFVEPELVETSSIDYMSTMMASPPAKKSRTEVRNLPGVLDAGAGNSVTFAGPEVNRRIARHFAREFGLRYSSSRRGAFTLLKQTKQILELVEPISSGASVAEAFLLSIERWPVTRLTRTVMIMSENRQGLLLWAILWQRLGCSAY